MELEEKLKKYEKIKMDLSYKNAVSALVDDGELSSDEIKELLQQVENQN